MSQSPSKYPAAGQPTTDAGGGPLIIIALVCALVAALLVMGYIQIIQSKAQEDTITLYRLVFPKEKGDRLKSGDYEAVPIPAVFKNSFPGAIDDPNSIKNKVGEKDQLFQMSVATNAVIEYQHFEKSKTRIDENIPVGKRRVWLPIDSKQVPAGLDVGWVVDIAGLFNVNGRMKVLTVMEAVTVVGVGKKSKEDQELEGGSTEAPRSFHTISIEVYPKEANSLSTIRHICVGGFILHLRKRSDKTLEIIKDGGLNPQVVQLADRAVILPENQD